MDDRRTYKRIKLGNNGSTLVELIISMAVAAIIFGSLTLFMWSSIVSYRASRDDIRLQSEAQSILGRLKDLIMEANNVKYDQADGILYIQHEESLHILVHNTSEHTLEYDSASPGNAPSGDIRLFGQYVDSFFVTDTGSSDSNSSIEISFKLKKGGRICEVSGSTVVLRNRIAPMKSLIP
jgi:hypothetical protein